MKTKTNTKTDSSVLAICPDLQRKIDAFCKQNKIPSAAFRLQDGKNYFTCYTYRDGSGCVAAVNGPVYI